jgi:hypothetical protein
MRHASVVILASVWLAAACGTDSPGPLIVGAVHVTSPIGARLAVGRDVQLVAEARTSAGQAIPGVTFTWSSSADGVADVSTGGLVSGNAGGDATISAEADGVSGQIAFDVIAADLPGVTTTTADALAVALVGALTSSVAAQVNTAIAQCASGVASGNFDTIDACLNGLRAQAAAATDPTDQVLLATLGLFADYIERLVHP